MIITGSEDAQVAGCDNRSSVLGSDVSDGRRVSGDGSLLDTVTSGGTYQEAILADHSINVGGWALEEVEESAGVQVGLLESQVELSGGFGLCPRNDGTENLGLQALCDGLVELNLSVKAVGGGP